MKPPPSYPAPFLDLLKEVDVPRSHLAPKHPQSVATTLSMDTVETMKGLAMAYGVAPRDIIRAAIVIGLECILGSAEELGHYGKKETT